MPDRNCYLESQITFRRQLSNFYDDCYVRKENIFDVAVRIGLIPITHLNRFISESKSVHRRPLCLRWKWGVKLCYLHIHEVSPDTPFMIRIRPATESDFAAILTVQQAAFGEYATVYEVSAWTTETLDSLKEDAKEKRIFVAEAERVIVGSVRFWTVAGVCVIRLLSVSPARQKHGVGKALIREIERLTTDAHKFYACTMLRTARNIQFFLSLGYKAETVLPNHYHHLDLICFAKYREPAKPRTLG